MDDPRETMENEESLTYDDLETTNDSSFPATFAGYFSTDIGNSLQSYFNDIANIWLNMGLPVSKRDEKIGHLRDFILNNVKKFHDDETILLNKQRNYRDYQLNEINKILKALSFDAYALDSSKNLLAQNKILKIKYKELLQVKTERMEQLDRITNKLKSVLHSLGLKYEDPIFATNIPSELELMNLRSNLMQHEQTLDTRKKKFEFFRGFVLQYQKELEYSPQNPKEQLFLTANNFIYSQDIMNSMADFYKKMTHRFTQAKAENESFKNKLCELFNRLDIDETVRKAFMQTLNGTFTQKKHLLKNEIEKYEIIKKNSMEKIIENTRKDIDQLIIACKVSIFDNSILESQDFTEELLIAHENEFEKLRKFNQYYSDVFEKLGEWEDFLEKYSELEKKSMDPNRFNNRGGALLQDERDRRMLSKKLPKLEKDIRSLVTMKESKENIPFNSYGLDIDQYFKSQWDGFKECKDTAKVGLAKKTGGPDSSKKSAISSSQKKPRYPLSPRTNNNPLKKAPTSNFASRKLFTSGESAKSKFELENELDFQRHFNNQDILHSTVLESDNRIFISSQTKLVRTPTSVNLRKVAAKRRMSRSCDDLHKLSNNITKRQKNPPFLP